MFTITITPVPRRISQSIESHYSFHIGLSCPGIQISQPREPSESPAGYDFREFFKVF